MHLKPAEPAVIDLPALPVVAVVGPTASGKSDLGVELAVALAGEVVNGDSMQVYRGMDIGTAKLSEAERRGVPHHVVDLLDVCKPSTVAEFQSWAREATSDCRRRGKPPILVGGSALYLRAVLDEFEFPGTDARLRQQLETDLAHLGPAELHARLQARDPAAAEMILASNGRRIVRALEVIELTGHAYRARLPEHVYAIDPVVQIGLDIPRDVLDARIAARVDQMWEAGLVEEVRRLVGSGLREGRTASRALGYRQVLQMLGGGSTEAQAREDTVRGTRRFARRQATWFRRDPRIRWLPYDAVDLTAQALDVVRSGA